MQSLIIWLVMALVIFIVGILVGIAINTGRKTVGTLIIDQTGEKDLWTVIFDEDLSDVENETSVVLKIRKKT